MPLGLLAMKGGVALWTLAARHRDSSRGGNPYRNPRIPLDRSKQRKLRSGKQRSRQKRKVDIKSEGTGEASPQITVKTVQSIMTGIRS